ncbi:MAG: hypothetical protein OXU81_04340 [Gammaproteobacteria bacterium]|nr:hypothetical protein [Gammaproteobacteria bacterium]
METRFQVDGLGVLERAEAVLEVFIVIDVKPPPPVSERFRRMVGKPAELASASLDAPALDLVVLAPDGEIALGVGDDLIELAPGRSSETARDRVVDELKLAADEKYRTPLVVSSGPSGLHDSGDEEPTLVISGDVNGDTSPVEAKSASLVSLRGRAARQQDTRRAVGVGHQNLVFEPLDDVGKGAESPALLAGELDDLLIDAELHGLRPYVVGWELSHFEHEGGSGRGRFPRAKGRNPGNSGETATQDSPEQFIVMSVRAFDGP